MSSRLVILKLLSDRPLTLTCFGWEACLQDAGLQHFHSDCCHFGFVAPCPTRTDLWHDKCKSHRRAPVWGACLGSRSTKMRIICDQCDRPITGTVKKLSGNFNIHPHCVRQFTGELTTPNPSTRSGKRSAVAALVRWKQNALVPCELVRA